MTKSEYQARINKLRRIVNKFESRLATKQNGRFGRATRLLGLTLAIADLQMEMFAYGKDDVEDSPQKEGGNTMRNRTHEQIKESKEIYRKHAERHKANDYPYSRCKRMMAYTAALTKAIVRKGARR